jgi:hypothetical protein
LVTTFREDGGQEAGEGGKGGAPLNGMRHLQRLYHLRLDATPELSTGGPAGASTAFPAARQERFISRQIHGAAA